MSASFVAAVIGIFWVDRLSKWAAMSFLPLNTPVPLWPPFLHFTYIQNPGAAFGLFQNQTFFLIASGSAMLVVFWFLRKELLIHASSRWGAAFLIAGDLGNMADRLAYGAVVDFIQLPHWPVFNMADICIDLGIILLLWYFFKDSRLKDKN